jgi:molybdopterin-containing oxidoreductase family iron-sulfur binding subunit
VALGYGRTRCGKVGEKVGVNAYPFITSAGGLLKYAGVGVSLQKTARKIEFARTQTHNSMEGRPIIKEARLSEYKKNPAAGNEGEEGSPVSLWESKEHKGHAWGMVIDLNKCTGCSACLIGCQSENNVPVVGRDEVRRSREMHWIRIDRYYSGSEDNPDTAHQPMMCQHCEHAPCETVCPVLATTHSSDGLNMQTYNRCVGTRYCANNCPYKVRRFNWFDYAKNDKFDYNMNNAVGEMVLNPDIVVRSRGVMEKCSMCLQRIQEGKLTAKKETRHLKEGDIKTACQQSCPADAIVFGDRNNHENTVVKQNHDKRFYHVLEELGVRPVVGYLTKIRNREGEG